MATVRTFNERKHTNTGTEHWAALTPDIVNRFVSMCRLVSLASNKGCAKVTEDFAIMKKAPTRAFFWLKALVGAFSVIVKSSLPFV